MFPDFFIIELIRTISNHIPYYTSSITSKTSHH